MNKYSVLNHLPKALAHFTSIETAIKILETKSIRFNRLDRVDDDLEAISIHHTNSKQLVFASCWTDAETNSHRHWTQYANNYQGVKITLPTLMFNGRHDNHKTTTDDRYFEIRVEPTQSNGDLYQINRIGGQCFTGVGVFGPTKLRYVSKDELAVETIKVASEDLVYGLNLLGTHKEINEYKWENEFRFRVFASFNQTSHSNGGDNILSPHSLALRPVITESIYIPLDEIALCSAQIEFGQNANNVELETLMEVCRKIGIKSPHKSLA